MNASQHALPPPGTANHKSQLSPVSSVEILIDIAGITAFGDEAKDTSLDIVKSCDRSFAPVVKVELEAVSRGRAGAQHDVLGLDEGQY